MCARWTPNFSFTRNKRCLCGGSAYARGAPMRGERLREGSAGERGGARVRGRAYARGRWFPGVASDPGGVKPPT